MEQLLELTVERHDGTTVVSMAGEIDTASAPELRQGLAQPTAR